MGLAVLLPRLSEVIRNDDLSWAWWLTSTEITKALLCAALGLLAHTRVAIWAWAGAAWFLAMALIEGFSRVGCEDGFSAHGKWEWGMLAALALGTYLIGKRHE